MEFIWPFFFLSFSLFALIGAIAVQPRRRCSSDTHWTEKARLGWPFRQFAGTAPYAGASLVMVFVKDEFHDWILLTLLALAIVFGAVAGLVLATRGLGTIENRVVDWFVTMATSWIAVSPGVLLIFPSIALGLTRPDDVITWTVVGFLVLFHSGVVMPMTLSVGRLLGLVSPASESVVAMSRDLARELKVPAPSVYVIKVAMANVFALPQHNMILLTPLIERSMEPDLLRAIFAHEIGHLTEVKRQVWIRVLQALAPVILVASIPLVRLWDQPFLPLLLLLGYLFWLRKFRAWSTKRETGADAFASGAGTGPQTLGRALERIHELGEIPAVLGRGRSTHPDLVQRLEALNHEPAWPAPEPPGRARSVVCILVAMAMLAGGAVCFKLAWL